MNCLIPCCDTIAEPCAFCAHHVQQRSVAEREDIVRRWEKITGTDLGVTQAPAAQGELFGGGA